MLMLIRGLLPILGLLALVVFGLLRDVHAQAPAGDPMRMPNAADIEAARKTLPKAAELDEATRGQQRGAGTRVPDAAMDGSRQAGPDLAKLAEQYEQIRRGPADAGQEREASGVLVFVSLGMPRAGLERLIADAERVPATLILRGAKDLSLKKTAALIQDVMGQRKVAWQIDPSLFKRFEVQAVPSFVLIDPSRPVLVDCGQSRCQGAAFSKVAGDVSLAFALAEIQREDAEFANLAQRLAARIGGSR